MYYYSDYLSLVKETFGICEWLWCRHVSVNVQIQYPNAKLPGLRTSCHWYQTDMLKVFLSTHFTHFMLHRVMEDQSFCQETRASGENLHSNSRWRASQNNWIHHFFSVHPLDTFCYLSFVKDIEMDIILAHKMYKNHPWELSPHSLSVPVRSCIHPSIFAE